MSKENIQDERIRLMEEIFDLFDSENLGYVEIKDSLKILASIGKKLEIEDENEFLSKADPKNDGRVTKENFINAVEDMYTIPGEFLRDIEDAFKFFDKDEDGKISCKEFKNILINTTKEYKPEEVDELFKTLDLDIDGYITIKEFINLWKVQ